MNKPISTKAHAIIDYVTIGKLLMLPRILGFSERLTNAITTVALGKLAYTLLTRHEGGVVKLLPVKAHLVMDAVGGAGLAALPWMLDEDDDATAKVVCTALGAFDVLASTMTQTRSPQEPRRASGGRRQPAVSRRSRARRPAIASPT